MTSSSDSLRWSAQYQLARSDQTRRLQGDKIILPQSALRALLEAAPVVSIGTDYPQPYYSGSDPQSLPPFFAGREARQPISDRQQQLPHPLTFRLVNPQNGRVVYAGIREFSSEENEVGLSGILQDALGLGDGSSLAKSQQTSGEGERSHGGDVLDTQLVTVHANQLPKGTYVRLRPLEAGYDPGDWKSLLERYLRDNFTTLTKGEVLSISSGRREKFQFLIDKIEPSGEGICIVDTDLEVVIEALNEDQARETLNRRLAKGQHLPDTGEGSSLGGALVIGEERAGQVVTGDYVDYEVKEWPRQGQDVCFDLEIGQDDAELDLFFSPLSSRQRAKPRDDEHVLGDFTSRPSKRIRLAGTSQELADAEALYISVHAYRDTTSQETSSSSRPIPFVLRAETCIPEESTANIESTPKPATDEVICKNCHQSVPGRTLSLHEAFCYRNNISCPGCHQVFLKGSETWKSHWHCSHDSDFGDTVLARRKHDSLFHPPANCICPNCEFRAFSLPILAIHRTSTCPAKEIICQFCHLATPQQGPDDPTFSDPAVILSGLTPHEFIDGARTTDCHLCNKPVRLRDMRMHLQFHDRDRLLRSPPRICRNALCGQIINQQQHQQQLDLCADCFAPLYSSLHDDASGKLLRRRVERRLLHQLMVGCGRPWCSNVRFCCTAATNNNNTTTNAAPQPSQSIQQLLPLIKPILDTLSSSSPSSSSATEPLYFCVDDQSSQLRRSIAETIAQREHEYRVEWWVYGLWETRGAGVGVGVGAGDASDATTDGSSAAAAADEKIIQRWIEAARVWLSDRAPRIGEEEGRG